MICRWADLDGVLSDLAVVTQAVQTDGDLRVAAVVVLIAIIIFLVIQTGSLGPGAAV